jgi:periplasmic copper chaperone A
MSRLFVFVFLILGLGACGQNRGSYAPVLDPDTRLEVSDAWARAVTGSDTGRVHSAAYFTLMNHTTEAVLLVEARADAAARTEIHEAWIEDGIARMRPAEQVEVPAGEARSFEPGGAHLMLMDLRRDLEAGQSLSITLRFADGSEEVVPFEVRALAR